MAWVYLSVLPFEIPGSRACARDDEALQSIHATTPDDTRKFEILEYAANHAIFKPIEKLTLNFFENKSDAEKILQTALSSLNPKSDVEQQYVPR